MFTIEKSSLPDILQIAECHKECFPESFSVKLGEAYVVKTFRWFLENENRFIFHVNDDNKVVGYCGAFMPRFKGDGSTSGMLQFAMREGIKGAIKKPWLLLHREIITHYPLLFKNIIKKARTIFFKQQQLSGLNNSKSLSKKIIGLVVIGVHPLLRGRGVFELLMNEFEQESRRRNTSELTLSVKKENRRAVNAYLKAGWIIAKEEEAALIMNKHIDE